MRRGMTLAGIAMLGVAVTTASAWSQGFPAGVFSVKQRFADMEERALAEPFIGVRTSQGLREGLFPVHRTGASTGAIVEAADSFLATLSPTQLMRTQFHNQAAEWRRWLNVDNGIYARQGTPLAEMSETQRDAAMTLLAATLSARGLEQSQAIMLTDQALKELNPDMADFLDPDLYYFTVMGEPSETEPWGWQLDGHHLVINAFILGDQMVMTPTFWGGEPAVSRQGSTDGNAVLQSQQDLGLALMQSLSPEQQEMALLEAEKTHDSMVAGAYQDNLVLDPAGLSASDMTLSQREALAAVIESYVGAMREPHAAIRMESVREHLDETTFAWIGSTDEDAIFYYRILSPVILIEFDHQVPVGTTSLHQRGVPTRDHIHTVVRTPNGNDYGRDLLRQHLEQAHGQ